MAACTHDNDDPNLTYDNCQGDDARIHALLIGVGKYSAPRRGRRGPSAPLHDLPGAARAAYRFARYLKEEFHEPEGRSLATLRLMVSPAAPYEEDDLRSLKHGPATRREVLNALQDWADDCNTNKRNLAILYVAGHGVALGKGMSMLFLADAPEEANQYLAAVNLSRVQEIMADCAAEDNIFLCDCCMLSPDDVPVVKDVRDLVGVVMNEFQTGGEGRITDLSINAARVGTQTFALREQGTLLSRGLLGAYTDRMGEDALLRTAGDIVGGGRFGIMAYQLETEVNPKLRELLRSAGHRDDQYEASITGRFPVRPIAIPEPTPVFEVVLRNVLAGRTPPVKVWFKRVGGKAGEGRNRVLEDARDGEKVSLPAGRYIPYVESAEGPLEGDVIELVKRQVVELPS